jgi:hypothetical protein
MKIIYDFVMLNIDELMKNASGEQRKILRGLRGLVEQEKKLIEETKRSYDKANFRCSRYRLGEDRDPPMTDKQAREYLNSDYSSSGRRFREIKGKIEKKIQDAKRKNILVVPYDNLK